MDYSMHTLEKVHDIKGLLHISFSFALSPIIVKLLLGVEVLVPHLQQLPLFPPQKPPLIRAMHQVMSLGM